MCQKSSSKSPGPRPTTETRNCAKLFGKQGDERSRIVFDTTTEAGSRAQRRLQDEEVAWLTTVRSDGQPQSVPVWFLWDGETFLIYSQPDTRKLKNIGRNPRVGLNLNSSDTGGDVVRAEGSAEILENFSLADEVAEYLEKYREAISRIGYEPAGFARDYSVALRVTPERWQVW